MSRTKHAAECGCIVSLWLDYRDDVQGLKIARPCPEHCRPEPAAAEADPITFETWEAEALRTRVVELEERAEELEQTTDHLGVLAKKHEDALTDVLNRLETLEQVAGYGPRAGDGYREIPAGERGEGG